jgi:allantoinase
VDSSSALVVIGDRVVLPDGVRPAAIHIRDGTVAAIDAGGSTTPIRIAAGAGSHGLSSYGFDVIDATGLVVSPGIVDSHVHVNDPGRAHWEGFDSASRAAAAGGLTTIVDMPLNSIPATTTADALAAKRHAAAGRCHVDVGFWGGVVPGNSGELEGLAQAGVLGFKAFLCPSGVDEFQHVTLDDLRVALPILSRLDLPLLVHAELPDRLATPFGDPRRYATWLASRPPVAEQAAIDLLIGLARESRARVHIVHLSSPAALRSIVAARDAGVAVTVETCPHYLTFASEEIPDGATAFKCAPPIRTAADRDALWAGLESGAIDLVATDHSPAPPDLKHLDDGDFVKAWGGIASLQLSLPAVWTGARGRGRTVDRLAEWLSAAPARLAGLSESKGRIAVGHDADLVIWDPDAAFHVEAGRLRHRHATTPYDRRHLYGRVHSTILRGHVVFDGGEIRGDPAGQFLRNGSDKIRGSR